MRYVSLFSGIEAASLAMEGLGWEPVAFAEIERFPSAVLAHRFPHVPNLGDVTKVDWQEFRDANGPIDLVVFGSPCQSFSVAGKRLGLDDPRGNLALYALKVVSILRPRWFVFENVPGLLSSANGRDFGLFLREVDELRYSACWRVLDAQHVRTPRFPHAVPQRRRRVFVVGYLGDWRRAAAVLFEPEGLRGHPPPRREAQKRTAGTVTSRTCRGVGAQDAANGHLIPQGGGWPADVAATLNTAFGDKMGLEDQHALNGASLFVPVPYRTAGDGAVFEEGDKSAPLTTGTDPSSHIVAFSGIDSGNDASVGVTPTLRKGGDGGQGQAMAVAFDPNQITSPTNRSRPDPEVCHTLPAASNPPHLAQPYAVRRLTPREAERLQGMPDKWTEIPWRGKPADQCPDGPRYKALGNSWAVNCGELIFERIKAVEEMAEDFLPVERAACRASAN